MISETIGENEIPPIAASVTIPEMVTLGIGFAHESLVNLKEGDHAIDQAINL